MNGRNVLPRQRGTANRKYYAISPLLCHLFFFLSAPMVLIEQEETMAIRFRFFIKRLTDNVTNTLLLQIFQPNNVCH